MRRTPTVVIITLLVGIIIGLLMRDISGVKAQQLGGSGGNLGAHHQHITFTLGPGQSHTLEWPRTSYPLTYALRSSSGLIVGGPLAIDPNTGYIISGSMPFVSDGETSIDNNADPYGTGTLTNMTTDKTISYHMNWWY